MSTILILIQKWCEKYLNQGKNQQDYIKFVFYGIFIFIRFHTHLAALDTVRCQLYSKVKYSCSSRFFDSQLSTITYPIEIIDIYRMNTPFHYCNKKSYIEATSEWKSFELQLIKTKRSICYNWELHQKQKIINTISVEKQEAIEPTIIWLHGTFRIRWRDDFEHLCA